MTDTTWLDEVLKPFTLDDFENHPAEYIAQAKATILTKLEEARIDELNKIGGLILLNHEKRIATLNGVKNR